ncbi:hypothetical protein OIO90_004047 [Microbotryomycetes sp. JL221]|nr:hypothetical protein OIO90_004047 [Microbotryomycetes sp. JL221]
MTRTATPRLLRDPSTLEQIASRWSTAWTSPNSAVSSARSAGPSTAQLHLDGVNVSEHVSSEATSDVQPDTANADLVTRLPASASAPLSNSAGTGIMAPIPDDKESVTWSSWDTIHDGPVARRVLIVVRASSNVTIWECSSLESWTEILNIESLDKVQRAQTSVAKSVGVAGFGKVVGAAVLCSPVDSETRQWTKSSPVVAFACRTSSSVSQIVLYSLRSHQVVHSVAVPGQIHRLVASNRRHLAASMSNPAAIHLYSLQDFSPLSCSPLTNVLVNPWTGAPEFDLGQGGRLLAYATSEPDMTRTKYEDETIRPGSGIIAHRGTFDFDSSAREIGVQDGPIQSPDSNLGNDVARFVGAGVKTGVKAIGELGSYWLARANAKNSTPEPLEATSASRPIGERASPSMLSSSPRAAGWSRRDSALEGPASPHSGTVAVVDLDSVTQGRSGKAAKRRPKPRAIAHFRASWQAIAYLSLSPSSTTLLVADVAGHSFDVFELRPSPACVPLASRPADVWHRYRLHRGLTNAKTVSVEWSRDSKFVAVGTGKGTLHVFPINPTGGGAVEFDKHFGPKVINSSDLPPLSMSAGTIARIRPPRLTRAETGNVLNTPPSLAFVPHHETAASKLAPSPAKGSSLNLQDMLIFQPEHCVAILARLSAEPLPTSVAEGTLAAASRGDVGKMASTAVSGLTQLMKSRGLGSNKMNRKGGTGNKIEWSVNCGAKASFEISTDREGGDVQEPFDVGACATDASVLGQPQQFSAQAEIQTSSRSPRVLPRTFYHSRQFTFFNLPSHHAAQAAKGNYNQLELYRVEVRSEVQVRQGRDSQTRPGSDETSFVDDDTTAFEGPSSFDHPIKSAMQTILDHGRSPSTSQPAGFPNGVAGKSSATNSRWRDAIPIRASDVNAGLTHSMTTMRRVGSRAVAVAGATAAHVGRSTGGLGGVMRLSASASSTGGASSSLSFEEDAVFADRLDEGCTDSTAATSQRSSYDDVDDDIDGNACRRGKDDDLEQEVGDWGCLEDDGNDNGLGTDVAERASLRLSPATASHEETLPFDDDFDDLELALNRPAQVPAIVAAPPPAAMSSFGLDRVGLVATIDGSQEASSLETSTAPVQTPALPIDISKRSSPLLAAKVASGSPSSVVSTSSSVGSSSGKKKNKKGKK